MIPIKYNPGFHTDEELTRWFIVRLRELELILETIRENTGPSNQHLLVIGPRGAGKTMLVRRVAAEVRIDPILKNQWYPLVFPEETYQVLTAGEFWLEALYHLADHTKDTRWHRTYEDLKAEQDEVRLRERALAQLMDFADEENKRLLLTVENLNMLLGQQLNNNADWDLRHTLQSEPRLMLLGTATTRFDEIDNIHKAWFEGFSTHELKPLNLEEHRVLWVAFSGKEVLDERLRPIQILTGGNPRLLTIFADFSAKKSLRELMSELIRLIDTHTEYFKSQLDSLAPAERKVFAALLDYWDPINAREVSQISRMEVNKASALLHRLVNRGIVMVIETSGRKKWYQAAERLYNIYYLMRRRNTATSRIQAVVRFMVQFYEGEELVQSIIKLAEEACKLEPELREDHYWAYQEIVNTALPELKHKIVRETPEDFFNTPDIPESVRRLSLDKTEQSYREAIELNPDDVEAWAQLGQLLEERQRFEEAEQVYKKAIELNPKYAWAWSLLGSLLYSHLKRFEEAEQACRRAIELDPEHIPAWGLLGFLLHKHFKRFDEAEQAYRKTIELDIEPTWPWTQLGQLLHENLHRFEEAEQAYKKAVELDPEYKWAWAHLGQLLHEHLQRFEEAENAYKKAIELDPTYYWAWAQLGQLLHKNLHRFEEAEQAYRKAIELEPKYEWAWLQLGKLLYILQHSDKAEQAYREAIKLNSKNVLAWALLGLLLSENSERLDEAEQACLKVMELKGSDPFWSYLIDVRLARGDDSDILLQQIHQYLDQTGRNAEVLNHIAWTFYESGPTEYLPKAEIWAREALDKKPDDWNIRYTLAKILSTQGKWNEAFELALPILNAAISEEDAIWASTTLLISAAAAGYAQDALNLIIDSESRPALEPLEVGLRIFLGEQPRTAQEILEIGQDVVRRIRKRQEQMQNEKVNE